MVLLAVITPMLLVIILCLLMRYCRNIKINGSTGNCSSEKSPPPISVTSPVKSESSFSSNYFFHHQPQQQQEQEQSQSNRGSIEMCHRNLLMQGNFEFRPTNTQFNSNHMVLSAQNLNQQQHCEQSDRNYIPSTSGLPYARSNPLIHLPCRYSSMTVGTQ